ASASFAMSRKQVKIDTSGNGANLQGATMLTFELSNVNVFAGVNGGLIKDPNTGNVLLDANGLATHDIKNATGLVAKGGSLGLAGVRANQDAGPDNRSYLAMTSKLGSGTLVGLPADITIKASDIAVEINRASGTVTGGATGGPATPLDWTKALDLNSDKTLTFFKNTPNATTVSYAGDFTRVAGKLNLKAFDELEANASFEMSSQTVAVRFGDTGGADLHGAQLL